MQKSRPFSRRRAWLIILAIAGVSFALVSWFAMIRFAHQQSQKPETIGVTFSQVQAERFGSDWHANYTALLHDLGFRHLRIVVYWDRTEPTPDHYDFSETDWMIQQAAQYGARITLVVGQRTLR